MKRHRAIRAAIALCGLAASSCVTFYQPLNSLQRPVLLDVHVKNFGNTRLLIRCHAAEGSIDVPSAQAACSKLRKLFSNQGAEVETQVPVDGRLRASEESSKPFDLVVDIRSRKTEYQSSGGWVGLLNFVTFTLVPIYEECVLHQDVTVHDGQGFLLHQEQLRARIVEYFGFGVFYANLIADLARDDENRVTVNAQSPMPAYAKYSRDFYGQLSQLVYNARVRAKVLNEFSAPMAVSGEAKPVKE